MLTRLPIAARLVGTAVDHRRVGVGPSEGVGPSVARVRQDLQDGVVDRETPHSHVLNIRGESYRLRERKQAGLIGVGTTALTGPRDDAATDHRRGGSIPNRRRWVKGTPALTP
jgi:hypothetical protein